MLQEVATEKSCKTGDDLEDSGDADFEEGVAQEPRSQSDHEIEDSLNSDRTLVTGDKRQLRVSHTIGELKSALQRPAVTSESPSGQDDSDTPVGLREWGTNNTFPLSLLLPITSPDDVIQITREGGTWRVHDRNGTSNLKRDGVPCRELVLEGGMEISFGRFTLIVESVRTRSLRAYCSRILGWGSDRLCAVDQCMRSIRAYVLRKSPLLISAEGDSVLLAQAIHRRAMGGRAPFVVADPRRANDPGSVRCPANYVDVHEAMMKAAEGTLCVRSMRLPRKFDDVLRSFAAPENRTALAICLEAHGQNWWLTYPTLIEPPPLSFRKMEIPLIISEYLSDARDTLGVHGVVISDENIDWIECVAGNSLPDIEKAAMRMVALRSSRNVASAADKLGMASVSLQRWLGRRTRHPVSRAQLATPSHAAISRLRHSRSDV